MRLTIKEAQERVGTLSKPSKMPGFGYSTPADDCITGSKLVKLPIQFVFSVTLAKAVMFSPM